MSKERRDLDCRKGMEFHMGYGMEALDGNDE